MNASTPQFRAGIWENKPVWAVIPLSPLIPSMPQGDSGGLLLAPSCCVCGHFGLKQSPASDTESTWSLCACQPTSFGSDSGQLASGGTPGPAVGVTVSRLWLGVMLPFEKGACLCAVCDLWLSSEAAFADHMMGKKHKKNAMPGRPRATPRRCPSPPTAAGSREVIGAFVRLDLATRRKSLPVQLLLVHQYLLAGVVPARRAVYVKRIALRESCQRQLHGAWQNCARENDSNQPFAAGEAAPMANRLTVIVKLRALDVLACIRMALTKSATASQCTRGADLTHSGLVGSSTGHVFRKCLLQD